MSTSQVKAGGGRPGGGVGGGRYALGMLTLHFDYPSPASAVALVRLQRLADDGYAVRFVGLDTLGLDVAVPPTLDQLDEFGRYRDRARDLGLPMRSPTLRPPTLSAHLVGVYAEQVDLGASWRWSCLRAYWIDGANLAEESVLVGLAAAAGLDEDAVVEHLTDRLARQTLRGRMTARRRNGIGGVPVIEADGGVFVSAELTDADLEQLASL